jgi:transposase-like protein
MINAKNEAFGATEGARKEAVISGLEPPKEVYSNHDKTSSVPDPEVSAKVARRRFTAEYKMRILKQADACVESGSQGALLRREGLYASSLNAWRRQRDRGVTSAMASKKRGRKEIMREPLLVENENLRKQNENLTSRLRQAEIIIDVQKKISNILEVPLPPPEEGGKS